MIRPRVLKLARHVLHAIRAPMSSSSSPNYRDLFSCTLHRWLHNEDMRTLTRGFYPLPYFNSVLRRTGYASPGF
jgi:hypothetical protein